MEFTDKNEIKFHQILLVGIVLVFLLWVIPYPLGKYVDSSFPFIREEDIPNELVGRIDSLGKRLCPPLSPYLQGITPRMQHTLYNLQNVSADSLGIKPGGIWEPLECHARYEVVIIVPYRHRSKQLQTFVSYMHPFLQRQLLHYRIIVVEQKDNELFNRAKLLNIGFKEAFRLGSSEACFVFHDVDLIPENDHNIYACTHHPRHMYSAVDVFRYHLPYRTLFGGVFSILATHFREVNGFSNLFLGWGGEDDDFSRRLGEKGLVFDRFDPAVARYSMIPHTKQVPSEQRWHMLDSSRVNRSSSDGLSTLRYELLRVEIFPLYVHIFVR